ncbi:CDGSH iron-sulfur domain-containing protein [Streptomyces litmocidini]|uniref:CDGSH iron-sulfur domain-containing protein n=1 Tax=Streptomyces litmocidini TaxID=67318 RepID=UPI00167DDCF1|nr:CDGSH iron-sulfur domain-containing protein [Streptomyces litmocidini]
MSASPNEGAPRVRVPEDGGPDDPGGARPRTSPPRFRPLPEGPLLVEGPAEIVMPDGSVIRCDRPVMALCTCRRSLRAPFCDTSHRPRLRSRTGAPKAARGAPRPARDADGEAEAS